MRLLSYTLVVAMIYVFLCADTMSGKVIADEVVDIYVGSNVTEGQFQFRGFSTDGDGNKVFSFNFMIDETEISYDHTQFRLLQWTLETTDMRDDPNRVSWADVQSGKVTIREWAKHSPHNKRTGQFRLPKSEIVEHFGPQGELPKSIICVEENLTIAMILMDAEPGSPSNYYRRLTIRIIIELED